MKMFTRIGCVAALVCGSGCTVPTAESARVPALEYSNTVRAGGGSYTPPTIVPDLSSTARARFVDAPGENAFARDAVEPSSVSPEAAPQVGMPYRGPLAYGDPGASPSLFRESRGTNDLFHDHRAWQPMDLVTITVTENTEGSKAADTKLGTKSTFSGAISKFFGLEQDVVAKNPGLDVSSLLNASATNEFDGEGETTRKGRLRGTISAMVAEVLPSGVLRVAGEKIVSVNGEEQIMILSGLVRPRDVSSDNQVDSSKIANMRIDYFGKGDIGDMQHPGWLARIARKVWPF
jgi:flagellar L-ring protein FlgH